MNAEEQSECRSCGKPIAAMLKEEAFCCACRYGQSSHWDNKKNTRQSDSYSFMQVREGRRITTAWYMEHTDEDEED